MSDDRLGNLVKKIFEIIDTYYIEWQAKEIEDLIQDYAEQLDLENDNELSIEPD